MIRLWIVIVLLCGNLLGCGSSGPTPEQTALSNLKWSYAENAIQLNLTADKNLNQYDGQAHNLLLVVAQFDTANAFSAYTGSSQQLSSLLLMTSTPKGMIGFNRIFIDPGQTTTVNLPRLEGSRMIGVAAGYSHLDPLRSAKLYQIGVDVTSTGFFSKIWTAAPQPIAIDLLVGPDALLRGTDSKLAQPAPEQPKAAELALPGAS
jgi:type VI secretion system VasD/TssJ family lipoprotein